MSIGPLEIIIVLVLALLIFGPKQLPQAGRSLGQAMREFRKATQTARTELGLDELTEGIKDLKSSASVDLGLKDVDLGLKDIKSAMTVDLKAAPAADKPVTVAAAGSDTMPAPVSAAETAVETAVETASTEPAPAAGVADAAPSTGASSGPDDA